jgi:hypothetical protein
MVSPNVKTIAEEKIAEAAQLKENVTALLEEIAPYIVEQPDRIARIPFEEWRETEAGKKSDEFVRQSNAYLSDQYQTGQDIMNFSFNEDNEGFKRECLKEMREEYLLQGGDGVSDSVVTLRNLAKQLQYAAFIGLKDRAKDIDDYIVDSRIGVSHDRDIQDILKYIDRKSAPVNTLYIQASTLLEDVKLAQEFHQRLSELPDSPPTGKENYDVTDIARQREQDKNNGIA